jgi:thioredoxin reductase (NADPH)
VDQIEKVSIVGAGPAGIAAAIYLKRAGFHPNLLDKHEPGGILRYAYLVENYPGFPNGIPGIKLVELFVKHIQKLGISITRSIVNCIKHTNDVFFIDTDKKCIVSSSIIIAAGTNPRKIKIKGSASIEGTSLFYDPLSIPLPSNQRQKRILVIGGGDIAYDYTMTLLKRGHEVTIISRSRPSCLPLLFRRVTQNGASIYNNLVPTQIMKHHKDILLQCRQKNQVKEFSGDFILIACGRDPNASFLTPKLKKYFYSISDIPRTQLPGLYFAGDVVRGLNRQVGIAVGDGIHAAMKVEQYFKDRTVKS